MTKPLVVGIVGAGLIVNNAHLPALMNTKGIQVAWLADQDPAKAASLGAAWSVRALSEPALPSALPNCDVALLAIPLLARAAYLTEFKARGTAVLCEKPFAQTEAEHIRFCDGFDRSRIGVGFQRRTLSQNRLLRELVARSCFGPLRAIRVQEGGRTTSAGGGGYFLDRRAGRSVGVLADLGSHSLDMIFSTVPASGVVIERSDMVIDEGVDRHVSAAFHIESPQGLVQVDYQVSWLDSFGNAVWWEFQDATLKMDLRPGGKVYLMGDHGVLATLDPSRQGARTTTQAFFLQWESFLRGVMTGTESEVSAHSAVWVTSAIDALHAKAGNA